MHDRIARKKELCSHGNVKARQVLLKIIEDALEEVDSYQAVKKAIYIESNETLVVQNKRYDLLKISEIFVIGSGKATFPMAQAIDEIFGAKISEGLIVVKAGEKRRLKHIEVIEAGHPIPNKAGLRGAKQIRRIAEKAGEKDVVFCLITGGASALLPLPPDGVSLEDKQRVTNLLLNCGARIDEINIVRNHLSVIKGGRLAMRIHPAQIINLIVIDEVAGLPWGPTVPDQSSFADAISVIKKYDLEKKLPESVWRYLERADQREETPKLSDFHRQGIKTQNILLADSGTICEAAEKSAKQLGYNAIILSSVMEGESREVGIALAGVAKEIEKHGRPAKPPCVVIIGGETTVTITGEPGEGGRNQELALASSLKIIGNKRIAIASIGTDGTDGPTDIAGGIVDGYTVERAAKKGIDIYQDLINHNSSHVFRQLGDAIFTGPTGTNVMDLRLLVITKP